MDIACDNEYHVEQVIKWYLPFGTSVHGEKLGTKGYSERLYPCCLLAWMESTLHCKYIIMVFLHHNATDVRFRNFDLPAI